MIHNNNLVISCYNINSLKLYIYYYIGMITNIILLLVTKNKVVIYRTYRLHFCLNNQNNYIFIIHNVKKCI